GEGTMIRAKRLLRRRKRAIVKCAFVVAAVILGCFVTLPPVTTSARADSPPDSQQVQRAAKTSDLMLATLFAALLQEFAETTPANVEEGKKSISLIFNDANEDMRLVGVLQPLRANDVPQDSFETTALARAMQGLRYAETQKVKGKWYFRRSEPLSNFHQACAMCHSNFGPVNDAQWVGALM